VTCVIRDAIDSLLAGVKALKKKGLAPRSNNVPYANAYGMPAKGFAFGEPLDKPIDSLPLSTAVPMRWQWEAPLALRE
jgi:hypothetical protein